MKKLIVALAAVAAFTGSASAADLGARPYTKAPMMAPAPSWTGFYIFGGAGGGIWDADSNAQQIAPAVALTRITGWAAMGGLEQSVPVATGSLTIG